MIYFNRQENALDFVLLKKNTAVLNFPVLNANIFADGKPSHNDFHSLSPATPQKTTTTTGDNILHNPVHFVHLQIRKGNKLIQEIGCSCKQLCATRSKAIHTHKLYIHTRLFPSYKMCICFTEPLIFQITALSGCLHLAMSVANAVATEHLHSSSHSHTFLSLGPHIHHFFPCFWRVYLAFLKNQ